MKRAKKKIIDNKQPLVIPQSWQQFPNGLHLRNCVELKIKNFLEGFTGEKLLALGALAHEINLSHCKINQRIRLDWNLEPFSDLVSSPDALALESESIDLIILPLLLNYSENHHQILREAHRVLVAGGKICIVAINPWSLWAIRALIGRVRNKPLWKSQLHLQYRICDWLALLQFEVLNTAISGPIIPWKLSMNKMPEFIKKAFFFEKGIGAMQVIIAEKKVIPFTLIKNSWKNLPVNTSVEVNIREAV